MDHSSHDTTSGTSGASMSHMMIPYLHFGGGDYLYFSTWTPTSPGAIAGACIGLFLLAIFERWFSGLRAVFEHHWRHRALLLSSRYSPNNEQPLRPASRSDELSDTEKSKESDSAELEHAHIPPIIPKYRNPRTVAPFVASQDIPRGIMFTVSALLSYLLMLAAMTYNAGFIISIVVGLGVGEVLFGRLGNASVH